MIPPSLAMELWNWGQAIFTSATISQQVQNEILAKGIPALSEETGRNELNLGDQFVNFNMASHKAGWPRNHETYHLRWLHNDIRKMAYLYTFKVFDEMVEKGELK